MKQRSDAMGWITSPQGSAAFADLWRVYDAHYDEIVSSTMMGIDKRLAASIGGFRSTANSATTTRDLLRDGMLEGRWDPYLNAIQEVGAYYARDGVPFLMWPPSVLNYAMACEQHVVDAHGVEQDRMLACLRALHMYVDLTFVIIAGEYVRQREATLSEQRAG